MGVLGGDAAFTTVVPVQPNVGQEDRGQQEDQNDDDVDVDEEISDDSSDDDSAPPEMIWFKEANRLAREKRRRRQAAKRARLQKELSPKELESYEFIKNGNTDKDCRHWF